MWQVCRPSGYFEVVDFQNQTDVWAFCVLRLVARHNNSGPDPLDILYDQPIGWWDSDWPGSHSMEGCYRNDDVVQDAYFEVRPAVSGCNHQSVCPCLTCVTCKSMCRLCCNLQCCCAAHNHQALCAFLLPAYQ